MRLVCEEIVENFEVTSDTTNCWMETWSDPGVYPSGGGGSALVSTEYPMVEGEISFKTYVNMRTLADDDLFDPKKIKDEFMDVIKEFRPSISTDETTYFPDISEVSITSIKVKKAGKIEIEGVASFDFD